MTTPPRSEPGDDAPRRHPFVAAICLGFVALAIYLAASNWRQTIASKRLDAAGIHVDATLLSADVHTDSGRRRGSPASTADVNYAFDFAGRHFVDTDHDLDARILAPAIKSRHVTVTVLPTDPDTHRVEPGHRPRDWEAAIAGTVFCLLFVLIFGLIGVALLFPRAQRPIPAPPPAEFFVRPVRFFDLPTPRPIRWRKSNLAWTALFTIVLLVPPAYAAAQWRAYLAHRAPSDSLWPWDSWAMLNCVSGGIPYFAVAVPMYFVRLARIRRCARLARRGRTTTGVVDWKLRVAWDTARRKARAGVNRVSINGTPIGELPGKEDWVTYRYVVNGIGFTGESADGRALLWRSHAIPPAVYLPTGREITVVYDPDKPLDSLLLPYLRYYLDLSLSPVDRSEIK